MRMRRMILAAAVLISGALGTPALAPAQTAARTVCETYCGAIAAGCYVFFGIFVRQACASMYEGCVDGCYAALLQTVEDEERSGGGGF